MAKQNKPAIRFKGFTDAWEQRKLGDCFTERCESMPDGELISVTINDGIKKFSELGRHDNSNDDKSKYKKVCAGDIAYNSMRMWQGASGCSPYEGIVSPAYTVLTPNSGINSKCMAYQFKLPATIHTFKINSQGITSDNWNLKFPALSEIEIYVSPYEQEQAKIAAYFANLDHLITLHQRKYDKLQVLKKAMLEKMFPKNGSSVPEIRFKGFTDAWEQRKLGEISEIKTGPFGSILHADDYVSEGVPIITTEHFKTGSLPQNASGLPQVSEVDYKRLSAYTLNNGDIVFSRVGSVDINALVTPFQRNWLFSGRVLRVRPEIDVLPQFLHTRLETESIKNDICARAVGQTMPSINTEILKATQLVLPTSMAEQKQIGLYFAKLDHLITLHQRELEKLQNIKKSMLEKMFV
jgi:type I restriction enzyme S subunit